MSASFKFLDYNIYAYDDDNKLITKQIDIPLSLNLNDIMKIKNNDGLTVIYKKLLDANFKNCDFKDIVLYILHFYDPTTDYRFEIYNNDKTQFFKLYNNKSMGHYMLTLNYDLFFINFSDFNDGWAKCIFNMFYIFFNDDSKKFLKEEYERGPNDFPKYYYDRITEFYKGYLEKHPQ